MTRCFGHHIFHSPVNQLISILSMDDEYFVVSNDERVRSWELLIQLKTLLIKQLPKISSSTIVKHLFDGLHESAIITDTSRQTVKCGMCFRSFPHVKMSNIIYFASDPQHLGSGYGTKLMSYFKNEMKGRGVDKLATHADQSSITFYQKMGFIYLNDKSKQELEKDQEYSYLRFVEEYSASRLMIYTIYPHTDHLNIHSIVSQQRQSLYRMIDGRQYRNMTFLKHDLQQMIQQRLSEFYEKKYGCEYYSGEQIAQFRKDLRKKTKKILASSVTNSKLEALAILDHIRSHPNSWLFKFAFKFSFQTERTVSREEMRDVLNLNDMERMIMSQQSVTSLQFCAGIRKCLANLKILLPVDTIYMEALQSLEEDVEHIIKQVEGGVFDVQQYFDSIEKEEGAADQRKN